MVSTAITLAVLVALFLVCIKLAVDVVREWPRKKSIASHFTQQRSGCHREQEHGRVTAHVGRALAALKRGKTIKTRMLPLAAWWDERQKRKSEQ